MCVFVLYKCSHVHRSRLPPGACLRMIYVEDLSYNQMPPISVSSYEEKRE